MGKKMLLIVMVTSLTGCYSYENYTPGVIPTGKGEVKKRQIKNGRT